MNQLQSVGLYFQRTFSSDIENQVWLCLSSLGILNETFERFQRNAIY